MAEKSNQNLWAKLALEPCPVFVRIFEVKELLFVAIQFKRTEIMILCVIVTKSLIVSASHRKSFSVASGN